MAVSKVFFISQDSMLLPCGARLNRRMVVYLLHRGQMTDEHHINKRIVLTWEHWPGHRC
jgi:hypothetical protein